MKGPHVFISAAFVYSKTRLTTVSIGHCSELFQEMPLEFVREVDKFNKYRIVGWQKRYPHGLQDKDIIDSAKISGHLCCTLLSELNEYGDYENPYSPRIGYSTRERTCFFVNYLGPPISWTRQNHWEYPPKFKREAMIILWFVRPKDVAICIIERLARLYS